jgi:hypothetical protein
VVLEAPSNNNDMKKIILNNIDSGYFACENGDIISKRGRILKPFPVGSDKRKYYAVDISINGKVLKSQYVHILVWVAFNGTVPNGYELNHIDGIKRNCSLKNLEVVTHSENSLHSFKMNLQNNQGENHPNKIINNEIALEIMRRIKIKQTSKEISKDLNISIHIVRDICRGKTWQHLINIK